VLARRGRWIGCGELCVVYQCSGGKLAGFVWLMAWPVAWQLGVSKRATGLSRGVLGSECCARGRRIHPHPGPPRHGRLEKLMAAAWPGHCPRHGSATHVPIPGRAAALAGRRRAYVPRESAAWLYAPARRAVAQRCSSRYAPPIAHPVSVTDHGTAPTTRKARAETALRQITNLQARRAAAVGGLARGQTGARRTAQPASRPQDTPSRTQDRPHFRLGRAAPASPRGAAPPGAQMIRAPSKLRITRDFGPQGHPTGPNLRGREGARGSSGAPTRPDGRGRGSGGAGLKDPGKRIKQKQDDSDGPRTANFADVPAAQTLSDGMVHNLLRLQRKEWDRVPYEPKYALGSFAANELIHIGRELFRGESPPVKVWGPLEKKIGVVGMFGAEATLKIRRVLDDNAEPFDQHFGDEFDQGSDQSSSELPENKPEVAVAQ